MLRQAWGCQWVMTKGEMCSSQLNARETTTRSPEQKRRKHHHQQPQHHNSWAGSSRYRAHRANVLLKLEIKHFYHFVMFISDSTVGFLCSGRWIKSVIDLDWELSLSRWVQSCMPLLHFVWRFSLHCSNFSFPFSLQQRKKKEPVVWDHTTYKQAVRKAMFARFKELEWSDRNTSLLRYVNCLYDMLVPWYKTPLWLSLPSDVF